VTAALDFLVRNGYAVLFAFSLVEQVGVPLPSTPILLAAGALASRGQLRMVPALLLTVLAALLGHFAWYEAGRRRGTKVLRLFCKLSLEPDSCVRRTQDLFATRGALTLFLAPWVPGLGGIAPPMAGLSGMSRARFLAVDAVSSLAWAGAFIGVGYLFADQLEAVLLVALRLGGWALVLASTALAAYLGTKLWQRRRLLRELDQLRITPKELKALLDTGASAFIIDVRQALESATGTLPGALRLALDEIEARIAEVPRDREVILYCS
jgi:membrane protein DedA with SNARE-associated domain